MPYTLMRPVVRRLTKYDVFRNPDLGPYLPPDSGGRPGRVLRRTDRERRWMPTSSESVDGCRSKTCANIMRSGWSRW